MSSRLPKTWTTKGGRVIPIKEMTNSQLFNTIRYLRRTAADRHHHLCCMSWEALATFDSDNTASCYAEQATNELVKMDLEDFLEDDDDYRALMKEAGRRKMTPERTKELLPVMQAFADGKTLEYRLSENHPWSTLSAPWWVSTGDYRIKPEPPKPREFWVNIYPDELRPARAYANKYRAQVYRADGCSETVHVREVLP